MNKEQIEKFNEEYLEMIKRINNLKDLGMSDELIITLVKGYLKSRDEEENKKR